MIPVYQSNHNGLRHDRIVQWYLNRCLDEITKQMASQPLDSIDQPMDQIFHEHQTLIMNNMPFQQMWSDMLDMLARKYHVRDSLEFVASHNPVCLYLNLHETIRAMLAG